MNDQAIFYNLILAHGDGSVKNFPSGHYNPDIGLCNSKGRARDDIKTQETWLLSQNFSWKEFK